MVEVRRRGEDDGGTMSDPTSNAINPENANVEELARQLSETDHSLLHEILNGVPDTRLIELLKAAQPYENLHVNLCAWVIRKRQAAVADLWGPLGVTSQKVVAALAVDFRVRGRPRVGHT